jgi:uncharacterized protein
MLITDIA